MVVPVPESISAMRVSDADRGAVVDLLTRAHAEGRLDLAEHSDRTSRALAAKTVADLGSLIEDLAPARIRGASSLAARAPGTGPMRATMSSTRREDVWTVPRTLHVSAFMGEVRIDMTRAVFTVPVVELDASVIMGEVKLIVPEGVNVIDESTHIMSEFKVKGSLRPAPDAPTIVVRGSSVMGGITAKAPR